MAETTQVNTDISVIQKALPILQSLPGILSQHQASVSGALRAVDALVAECEAADKITAEMDEKCKTLIIKVNKTGEKMVENRSQGTQMMALMAKMFTGEENKLKDPVAKLQAFRNRRAKEVVEENKRLEEEARVRAARGKEAADCVAYYTMMIGRCLNNKLADRKAMLHTGFDSITLEDFEERSQKLRVIRNDFPVGKMEDILKYPPFPDAKLLPADEVEQLHQKARREYGFDSFYASYLLQCDEVKNSLVDRLPSKLTELKEKKWAADAAAKLKKDQEEARKQQEETNRQAREAKDKETKERLEREQQQQQQRQAELDRQAKEQQTQREEQQRQEQERKNQEAEKLEQERLANEQNLAKHVEISQAGAVAQSLFDQTNAANEKQVEGETRKGWKINVTHMAGWAELFQFWYMAKAASTPLDKFGGLKLDQIKAYAEDQADKEKISSKYLTYEETITAVNRKVKTSTKPTI